MIVDEQDNHYVGLERYNDNCDYRLWIGVNSQWYLG